MKAAEVYEQITAQVIAAIEKGLANPSGWKKPWSTYSPGFGKHVNATTSARYNGMNQLILWAVSAERDFRSPQWATFKQWQGLSTEDKPVGVRKGEHGTHLVKWVEQVCKAHGKERGAILSCGKCDAHGLVGFPCAFVVFNAEQVDGYDYEREELPEPVRLANAEAFFAAIGANYAFDGGGRAYYDATADAIHFPKRELFADAFGIYATMAHEFTHWTGHTSRLDRGQALIKRFGDHRYAMEELTAELGGAFVMAHLGIRSDEVAEQNENYLANWLSVLRDDPKALAHVATKAQAAADYLITAAEAKAVAIDISAIEAQEQPDGLVRS